MSHPPPYSASMADYLSARLLVPLPVIVDGGVTRWKIYASKYGKNGKRMEVLAQCLSDPTQRYVALADGRTGVVERQLLLGLTAERGTTAARLFLKLVREGRAELLDTRSSPFE